MLPPAQDWLHVADREERDRRCGDLRHVSCRPRRIAGAPPAGDCPTGNRRHCLDIVRRQPRVPPKATVWEDGMRGIFLAVSVLALVSACGPQEPPKPAALAPSATANDDLQKHLIEAKPGDVIEIGEGRFD